MIEKVKIPGAVLLLFLSSSAGSNAQVPAANLIQAQKIKAEVAFLASPQMAGRKTGSSEAAIAAAYLASEFQALGLKPAGDQGGYYQDYDLIVAAEDDSNTRLKAQFPGIEKHYQINHDFDLNWMSQSTNPATASGALVFLGYGVKAPEYDYNDFASVDVRGKIVMILAHEPQESDPKSRFKGKWHTLHAYDPVKYEDIIRAGAVGILEVHESHEHRPPAPASAPRLDWFPSAVFSLPGLWDLPAFAITEALANELLKAGGKDVATLQSAIDSTAKPASFEVPGVRVTMDRAFSGQRVTRGRNVVAVLEGSDPRLKDEYVVVSAHYDHLGIVNGRVQAGADDNASGVAGLLEIARAFAEGKVKPRRSILFLSFDGEEEGLLGAFNYARNPLVPLPKIVANLNMDMIGRDENTPTWQLSPDHTHRSVNIVGTLYSPDLRKAIEKENEAQGLVLDFKTDTDDREEWFARSDHFVFASQGIPSVLFNTGEHPDYHTENDTWERLNYPKLESIIRLVFSSAARVANDESRPRFTP